MDLQELQRTVQDAIDKGARSVEQVHKQIANMPLDFLMRIEQLQEPVGQAKDFQTKTIGSVYDTIANINAKAGEMARELLGRLPNAGGAPSSGAPKPGPSSKGPSAGK